MTLTDCINPVFAAGAATGALLLLALIGCLVWAMAWIARDTDHD